MKNTIVIIDTDKPLVYELSDFFSKEGYIVETLSFTRNTCDIIESISPVMILIELNLMGSDGADLCSELRKNYRTEKIPIIVISERKNEADIVTALKFYADDYLTKPFSLNVLAARVEAVLRRTLKSASVSGEDLSCGQLHMEMDSRIVTLNKKRISLTKSEFDLLELLMRERGRVVSRKQILMNIRSIKSDVTNRAVDVIVVNLRKKLANAGKFVETVRSVGYRFSGNVS